MKIVFSLSLLLFLCPVAHGTACPTGQPKDEAALVQIEHRWVQAVEQHDPAALGCIVADEFEEADFDGSLISRSTMLANATKPSNGHSELTNLHVHIYGDVAYVRGIGVNSEKWPAHGKNAVYRYLCLSRRSLAMCSRSRFAFPRNAETLKNAVFASQNVKSKEILGLWAPAFPCPKGQSCPTGLASGATFITKHIGKYWSSLSIAWASRFPVDYVSVCEP